jgi:hypothetical protein
VPSDPLNLARLRRADVTDKQIKLNYPKGNKREIRKYYERQNELIDRFLGANDEERLQGEEIERDGPKVKFAIWASFCVNFCLFIIQLYAAISTGALSVCIGRYTLAGNAWADMLNSSLRLLPMPL